MRIEASARPRSARQRPQRSRRLVRRRRRRRRRSPRGSFPAASTAVRRDSQHRLAAMAPPTSISSVRLAVQLFAAMAFTP